MITIQTLDEMTVSELRELCKLRGLRTTTRMRKAELRELLCPTHRAGRRGRRKTAKRLRYLNRVAEA